MQRVPLDAVIALAGQVLHAGEMQACLAGDLDAKDVASGDLDRLPPGPAYRPSARWQACTEAIRQFPDEVRLRFQRALAYARTADIARDANYDADIKAPRTAMI